MDGKTEIKVYTPLFFGWGKTILRGVRYFWTAKRIGAVVIAFCAVAKAWMQDAPMADKIKAVVELSLALL